MLGDDTELGIGIGTSRRGLGGRVRVMPVKWPNDNDKNIMERMGYLYKRNVLVSPGFNRLHLAA